MRELPISYHDSYSLFIFFTAIMATLVEEADNKVVALFEQLSLKKTVYAHEPLLTIDDTMKHMGHISGSTLAKNLFIKDKKHGFYVVTVKHDRDVNMKTLAAMLQCSGANFRFADEAVLMEKLGIVKGSVSPLALMNDEAGDVKFAMDKELMDAELIHLHPLRNDRTVLTSPADLATFLAHVKHETKVLDFANIPAAPAPADKAAKPAKPAKAGKPITAENDKGMKKETLLGLSATKEGDFSNWYTQAITLSEMIDYSDISGCYILRPWSYRIWEEIQSFLDSEFKKGGTQNSYFPMFASERALNTEKEHVEGFAPEVAWVTRSGTTDLAEPLAVRPTSETIMYPFFAKWIRSHRDLPLNLNQWCNVVRWEFKDATPFLRSREFLWQEGHTAHTTQEDAQKQVLSILDVYEQAYEQLLAVPVVKGTKTETEKFAGGLHTTTVEAFIHETGRAIQSATSHNLGQNFGKMFKIFYENEEGGRSIPWQTSWGFTTRSIGVCVMCHGDDKGLVLPPRIAPIQVIICPILMKTSDEKALVDYSYRLRDLLKSAGIRADVDQRKNYTPGWKYNHWEQKGVPLRVELGPRDLAAAQARVVRRDNGEKLDISVADEKEAAASISALLTDIQDGLLARARAKRDDKIKQVLTWADFVPTVEQKCMALTPFCNEAEWEEKVKKMSRDEALRGEIEADTCATSVAAKTLCIPFDQPPLPEGTMCFVSGKPAQCWVLWGRSY